MRRLRPPRSRGFRSAVLRVFPALVFMLWISTALAVEEKPFELYPKWLRPEAVLTVKLPDQVDASRKLALRLIGPTQFTNTVRDLPLDAEALRTRRLAEVKIAAPLRQGVYKTQLIGEAGTVVLGGPDLRIAAAETPAITKIVPQASYALNDRYDFEILGTGFSYDAQDVELLVNDLQVQFKARLNDREGRLTEKDCGDKRPCLVWNWRALRVYGFAPEEQRLHRPMRVSVEVDGLVSNEKPLLLAYVQRSTPVLIAFLALGGLAGLVYFFTRDKAGRYSFKGRSYNTFAFLFIDSETNTYSLSKFQLVLWTAAAVMAYTYIAAAHFLVQWTWVLPKVPEGLPALLGLSVGTSALAVGATGARGSKGAGPLHPSLGDFVTSGGVLAVERLQFLVWTIVGACGFVAATLIQEPGAASELPKVPENFVPLMGVSSLGYLAGKITRKAGPVIKQLDPPGPYTAAATPAEIRIVGENLSPRAQVWLNGALLPAAQVTSAAQTPEAEFVTELVLKPAPFPPPAAGAASVKVMNRDGQCAEF